MEASPQPSSCQPSSSRPSSRDSDSSGLAIVSMSGLTSLGDSTYIPLLTSNNLFQETGSVSYLRAPIASKTGADLRRRQTSVFQSATSKGQFNFDSNLTNDPSGAVSGSGNAVALSSGDIQPPPPAANSGLSRPRNWESALYIQDDWRVTHSADFECGSAGVAAGPTTEVANRISNVDLVKGRNHHPGTKRRLCFGWSQFGLVGLCAPVRIRRDGGKGDRNTGWLWHQLGSGICSPVTWPCAIRRS